MSPLDRLRDFVRARVPLFVKIEEWAYGLPAFPGAIVTALGHALLTAASLVFAPVVATLYTIRELKQKTSAPLYDSVLDIVLPWLVVALYAFILGRIW